MTVSVQVGDGNRIHGVRLIDRHQIGKFHAAQIEIDESAAPRLVADNNVQASVAVEVNDGDVARRPASVTERAGEGEATFPIAKINDLLVWGVIPNDEVESAVAVQVSECRRVGSVCPVAKIVSPVEVSFPVV